MWILVLILLLLEAQFNLTAIVPLQPGTPPPPWWVGGRLLWPFAIETHTLIPAGDTLSTITPLLGIISAVLYLMAVAALLRRIVPESWFQRLIVVAAVLSVGLQVIWFSPWAILPVLVDIALLWVVFRLHLTVVRLRG